VSRGGGGGTLSGNEVRPEAESFLVVSGERLRLSLGAPPVHGLAIA
jgi:hypothetical protein